MVYVLIFSYTPMIGVIMAFKKYNFTQGLFASAWVGLKNFKFLMVSNKLWPLTRNTLLYNLAFISIGMVMEVGFAVIINEMRCRWFKKVFQSFIFLPYFISWVIASAVVQTLLDYDFGLISRTLKSLGLPMVNVYVDARPWPFLLVFFRMWKGVGYGSIVYLSAISGIDSEMYEAADIDGANSWQKLFRITLPNLVPTMVIMFLLACGQIFRGDFGMFYQLIFSPVYPTMMSMGHETDMSLKLKKIFPVGGKIIITVSFRQIYRTIHQSTHLIRSKFRIPTMNHHIELSLKFFQDYI